MKNYKKISIFDLDQTLLDTPTPEEGKKIWKEKTGKDWQHRGWWGRKDSLDTNIFNIEPNQEVFRSYEEEKQNPDSLLVMMTGRHEGLRDIIIRILDNFGLKFDIYSFKKGNPTLDEKIEKFNKLIDNNPSVETVEIWEDREEHVKAFQAWGEEKEQEVVVNQVG